MVRIDPAKQAEYRDAWESWQRQLARLHGVFLEGEPLEPPKLKGLLNREARAKQRYDAAREALLGIGGSPSLRAMGAAGAIGRLDSIGRSSGASIHSIAANAPSRPAPLDQARAEERDER